jgi:hypothetical protein
MGLGTGECFNHCVGFRRHLLAAQTTCGFGRAGGLGVRVAAGQFAIPTALRYPTLPQAKQVFIGSNTRFEC